MNYSGERAQGRARGYSCNSKGISSASQTSDGISRAQNSCANRLPPSLCCCFSFSFPLLPAMLAKFSSLNPYLRAALVDDPASEGSPCLSGSTSLAWSQPAVGKSSVLIGKVFPVSALFHFAALSSVSRSRACVCNLFVLGRDQWTVERELLCKLFSGTKR